MHLEESKKLDKNDFRQSLQITGNFGKASLYALAGLYSKTKGGGQADVTQQGITRHLTYMDGGREEWMAFHGVVTKGVGHWSVDANIKVHGQTAVWQAH